MFFFSRVATHVEQIIYRLWTRGQDCHGHGPKQYIYILSQYIVRKLLDIKNHVLKQLPLLPFRRPTGKIGLCIPNINPALDPRQTAAHFCSPVDIQVCNLFQRSKLD